MHNMTFLTPVVSQITSCILYHPNAQSGQLNGLPKGNSGFARMLCSWNIRPNHNLLFDWRINSQGCSLNEIIHLLFDILPGQEE